MAAYAAIFLYLLLNFIFAMFPNVEITSSAIRFAAMTLLAIREHSAQELYQKLNIKFKGSALIAPVITALIDDGLQSDQRFAISFTRMRARQGKGFVIVQNELKQRGISTELISSIYSVVDIDWHQLAFDVRKKKFGQIFPKNSKEKAKQIRFLIARGFSQDCVQSALSGSCDD